ncbi:MAG: hypothetical protein G01um10148_906 [Parcubacteria group bacterium Gr01-1014_8]|nr:MAG: hypothetical protein G01um10148_906 [Parcubacteria group bacterium Gr01-1014_8]
MVASFFVASLILPLVAGVAALLLLRTKAGHMLTQLVFALGGLSGVVGATLFYASDGASTVVFHTALFSLVVGTLSVFFLGIISVGVLLTSLYALEGLRRYKSVYSLPWLAVASAFFIFGMQATVMASSVAGFLVAWELMSVAAYFLVIADGTEESLHAGFSFFIMAHIGFASLVAGFLLLSAGNPFAEWPEVALAAKTMTPATLSVAFSLLFIGFGSKAGLAPLHQWLPMAHPQAPSHASALLSGVMLKVALFGFIQSLFLFPSVPLSWGVVVLVVGLVSAFFGVLHAVVESDMKRVLAWSSIENMGLIFSGVGAAMILRTLPYEAGPVLASSIAIFVALHIINHFLFKSGLFMAAGVIVSEVHSRDMDIMGGLAQKWPIFSGVFLALALAAAALPPFGTFFGEWMYLQSLALALVGLPLPLSVVAGLVLAAVALVSGLAIVAFVKMFSSVFLGRARNEHAEHVGMMPMSLMWPPMVCAILSIVAGVLAFPFFSSHFMDGASIMQDVVIVQGASMNAWILWALIAGLAIIALLLARFLRVPVRITDTWDCGQPLTSRMEYTATGFSAPFRFFFRAFLVSRKEMIVTPISSENPWIANRRLEWSITSTWERLFYRPVGQALLRFAEYARKFQSGVVQMYLLFVVIALVGAFIFAL